MLPCPKGCLIKSASAAVLILAAHQCGLRWAPSIQCLCGATGTMKRLCTGSDSPMGPGGHSLRCSGGLIAQGQRGLNAQLFLGREELGAQLLKPGGIL